MRDHTTRPSAAIVAMDFSPNTGAGKEHQGLAFACYADELSVPLHFLNGRAANPGCIDCTGVAVPACPSCPSGTACVQNSQTCTSCVTMSCISTAGTGTSSASSSGSAVAPVDNGPNTGAIVGGVIGGIAAIAILVYLTWRFCIKNKRGQYEPDWVEFQHEPTDAEKDFSFRRDQRASTHTVGSIASTVLTRASNIIQIAYIPGLSNRSTASTPGLLVPPVPPIPLALAPQSNSPAYTDEHFFMPGDLRDSTYSAMTAMTDRTSFAPSAFGPRSSVASTIYGKNAVVSPVKPQMIVRGKAAQIIVNKSGAGTPGSLTPPVPSIDMDKYGEQPPPSPAFSVGSTFLNTASAANQARPQIVRMGSKTQVEQVEAVEEPPRALRTVRDSNAITIIEDSPVAEQGPFADPESATTSPSHSANNSLSAVIEEATRKATSDVRAGLGVNRQSKTPFGDENETK